MKLIRYNRKINHLFCHILYYILFESFLSLSNFSLIDSVKNKFISLISCLYFNNEKILDENYIRWNIHPLRRLSPLVAVRHSSHSYLFNSSMSFLSLNSFLTSSFGHQRWRLVTLFIPKARSQLEHISQMLIKCFSLNYRSSYFSLASRRCSRGNGIPKRRFCKNCCALSAANQRKTIFPFNQQ